MLSFFFSSSSSSRLPSLYIQLNPQTHTHSSSNGETQNKASLIYHCSIQNNPSTPFSSFQVSKIFSISNPPVPHKPQIPCSFHLPHPLSHIPPRFPPSLLSSPLFTLHLHCRVIATFNTSMATGGCCR